MNDKKRHEELHEKLINKFGVNYKFWMTQGLGGIVQSNIREILVTSIKSGVEENDLMDLITNVIIPYGILSNFDDDIFKCIIKDAVEEAKNER